MVTRSQLDQDGPQGLIRGLLRSVGRCHPGGPGGRAGIAIGRLAQQSPSRADTRSWGGRAWLTWRTRPGRSSGSTPRRDSTRPAAVDRTVHTGPDLETDTAL